jgi:hypothetical protein
MVFEQICNRIRNPLGLSLSSYLPYPARPIGACRSERPPAFQQDKVATLPTQVRRASHSFSTVNEGNGIKLALFCEYAIDRLRSTTQCAEDDPERWVRHKGSHRRPSSASQACTLNVLRTNTHFHIPLQRTLAIAYVRRPAQGAFRPNICAIRSPASFRNRIGTWKGRGDRAWKGRQHLDGAGRGAPAPNVGPSLAGLWNPLCKTRGHG